ncbi:hypothetical protein FRACYDRAFT_250377 [Fragilariopsis cylindrus CCMP1102]|uniref:Uncharacterized protein n=1 Tax=Fragilariopsis cylindrus CCMP1102 TaxID=635003 RepID=A0A1E7EQQ4_9STRA|nr:hypothetical protein FRACYDRAFT_250377 [Fragilariopsis cylindrus CCMP1102]|eukprot:OEU08147.1 hypothetical protein FRACYDRAFT_250377 [Fragilariopsis cylindrus CCMP1102]
MTATWGFQLVPTSSISRSRTRSVESSRSSRPASLIISASSTTITRSTHFMAATPPSQEAAEQAVVDFKMITEEESQLRKIGGIILGVITIISFFTIHNGEGGGSDSSSSSYYYNYANLSTGAFAALSTYRCIVNSNWNIGSPFSFEKVPEQFQGFVKEKQLQIVNNVLTSAVFGAVVANTASLIITGDVSTELLVETTKAVLPIFGLVAAASGAITLVNNNNSNE